MKFVKVYLISSLLNAFKAIVIQVKIIMVILQNNNNKTKLQKLSRREYSYQHTCKVVAFAVWNCLKS